MASNRTYISLDSLKAIATSLQSQKDQIASTYKSNIKPAIQGSADCFKVAGLNLNEITTTFNSTFNEINTNLEKLITTLNNSVIKNYSETAYAIRDTFNNTFASKLREILGLKK